jgi:exonuclease SbcC
VDLVLRLEADHESKQREAQTAAAILGRGLEESRAAREELEPAIASLRQMEGQLEAKEFAREERKEVARLDARLAELGYDPERQDALQLEIDSENTRISRLETDLADTRQRTHSSAITLSAELKEARKASDELGPRRSELEGVDRTLAGQDFAHAERASREDLAGRLARLGYDAESHRKAGEEVRELGPYADLSRRLLEAEDRFPQERAAMTAVQGTLARRRHDLDGDAARRAELARELDALPSVRSELDEARSVLEDMARRERDALAEQKYLRDRLASLAEVEGQVAWQEQHRGEMLDQKSVYDELAVAYGGNGIQALIIETAIPQLNDDANELLGRLTDHGLSLKLQLREGRRERRIGIRSEELEIMIGDEWGGTRSYETFSGGETFLINFALRVALSKLLARRSGAPLPILFIDEGFGSQDAGGQERLKEVIQSIQSDFEKIVVITHVEQVKEAFPTRIEVTKTSDGSTFVVV